MAKSTVIGSIFQVRDLTAGVNLRPSPTNIKPAQARRLLNTLISNTGELGMYPGWAGWLTSVIGADRIQGARRIYLNGLTFTLLVAAGKIYGPTDGGVPSAALYSGLSAANEVDLLYNRDIVVAFDGLNVPVESTDGGTWRQFGISPPVAAPTLTAINGGSLPDVHTFSVSYAYYDSTNALLSNESTAATVATAAPNLTVRAAVVASADARVSHIKVYAMDTTAGESIRRLEATIANTTGNHSITVNNWDGQDEAPTDNTVPVAMSFGTIWKNRWWGRDALVNNRLRFSQIFQPSYWPVTYYVDIPFQRGEAITALHSIGDTLIVFGYTQFFVINGQTALDFEVRPAIGSQTGALGFRAVDSIDGGVVHAGASGVYLFTGSSDQLLTSSIEPAWQYAMDNSTPAQLARVPVTYHQTTKELRIAVSQLYPNAGYGEWIMDLNRGRNSETGPAWFSTDRAIGGYYQYDGQEASAGDAGRIFSWLPTASTDVNEERTGMTADGSSRTMEYDGFVIPLGLQVARIIDSYLEFQQADGAFTVDLKVDGRLMGGQTVDTGDDLARYGTATYHVSTYVGGSERVVAPVMWPTSAEGRTVQLLARFVGTGDFKLYSYGHNGIMEPLPRGF